MTAVIDTRGLAKRYRRVTALSDCAVTVPEGRISALIGPNGAGKTTLLRLLAGLAHPSAGEMTVLGGPPRQDPAFLAEIGFLGTLAEAVADGGLTVVLSSHLLADMERIADHLILLAAARVQLCGDIDALLAEHRVLVGPRKPATAIEKTHAVVQARHTPRQTTLLVRGTAPVSDPDWESAEVGLEEMVLGYMGQDAPPALTMAGDEK